MIEIHPGDYLQGLSCQTCGKHTDDRGEWRDKDMLIPKEDLHAISFSRNGQGTMVHICTWCIWDLQKKLNALGRKSIDVRGRNR
jgi:hypothetical protein